MTTPIHIRVVEDRSVEAVLPAESVAEIWRLPNELVEIRPTYVQGEYRILAGGKVGVLETPSLRIVVEPKIPGVNIRAMIDPETPMSNTGDISEEPIETVLLDALALRLARLMCDLADRGLRSAYTSESRRATFLSGRWDIPAQLRDPQVAEFAFHIETEHLSANSPVHQFPKAVACKIATILPRGSQASVAIEGAIQKYESVSIEGFDLQRFAHGNAESLADPAEREVFEFAQLIFGGFDPREMPFGHRATFRSLDLHLVFERYVASGLRNCGEKFDVVIQPTVLVGTDTDTPIIVLSARPDLLVQVSLKTIGVLDTKWKRFDGVPSPSDLQQIITYLHITASKFGMLVYPGDADSEIVFAINGGGELVVRQIKVTGSATDCRESLLKLAAAIRDRSRPFEE